MTYQVTEIEGQFRVKVFDAGALIFDYPIDRAGAGWRVMAGHFTPIYRTPGEAGAVFAKRCSENKAVIERWEV